MPALRRNYHKKEQKRGEKKKMQKAKEQKENNKKTTNQRRNVRKGFMFAQGITIIALVITILFSYDEKLKYSNSKGFLLQTI